MRRLSHFTRISGQLVGYSTVHREWWLLGLVLLLGVAAVLVSAGHTVAPYTVYALF